MPKSAVAMASKVTTTVASLAKKSSHKKTATTSMTSKHESDTIPAHHPEGSPPLLITAAGEAPVGKSSPIAAYWKHQALSLAEGTHANLKACKASIASGNRAVRKALGRLQAGVKVLMENVRKSTGLADKAAYERMAQFCWDMQMICHGPSEKPEERLTSVRTALKSGVGHFLKALKNIGKLFLLRSKK